MQRSPWLPLTLLLAACADFPANSEQDPDFELARHKTFSLGPNRLPSPKEAPRFHESTDEGLCAEIVAQLGARGYDAAEPARADFHVSYTFMALPAAEIVSLGRNERVWFVRNWYDSVRTANYTEGRLTIDVLDRERQKTVWQGWVDARILVNRDRDATVREAVQAIMARFPPQRDAEPLEASP